MKTLAKVFRESFRCRKKLPAAALGIGEQALSGTQMESRINL